MTTTDGQICYGVIFDEDTEFPWGYDIPTWWKQVHGYTNPMWCPFTKDGQYTPGSTRDDSRIDAYFDHSRNWDAQHPIPISEVDYCSGDYPMSILAVPRTYMSNSRGYPQAFNPSDLTVTDEEREMLLQFCEAYGLEHDKPRWWLSSYWG